MAYSRKLEKAENAVALYRAYSYKLIELRKSIELTITVFEDIDESDKDLQVISNIIEKNSNFLGELESEKYAHINAVHLYFDLDEDAMWSEQDLEKLLDAISRIGSINSEIKFWSDNLIQADTRCNEKGFEYFWGKMKDCVPNYVKTMKDFLMAIERSRLATEEMVKKIKMQVKPR